MKKDKETRTAEWYYRAATVLFILSVVVLLFGRIIRLFGH